MTNPVGPFRSFVRTARRFVLGSAAACASLLAASVLFPVHVCVQSARVAADSAAIRVTVVASVTGRTLPFGDGER